MSTWDAKVMRTECQVWIGACNKNGYGICTVAGRQELAHRVAYEREYGPIPVGMTLDHMCRVRNCVTPSHLEPVTIAENSRRGRQAASLQVGDTCQNDHLIADDGLYVRPSGITECRACRAAAKHKPASRRPTRQRRAERVRDDLAQIKTSA